MISRSSSAYQPLAQAGASEIATPAVPRRNYSGLAKLGYLRQGQVTSGRVRLAQVGLGNLRQGQVTLGRVYLAQVGLGQLRQGQVSSGRVRLGSARLRYVGSKVWYGQVKHSLVRLGYIRFSGFLLFTCRFFYKCYFFLEQMIMLKIRHKKNLFINTF